MESALEKIKKKIYEVHGESYKVAEDAEFNGFKSKIKMVCPTHGVNYASVGNVIYRKSGCPLCGRERAKKAITMSFEEFEKRAIERHGIGKFDYSVAKIEWTKLSDYVTIKCNTCGKEFKQSGVQHLCGNGCPHCHPFPKAMDTETFKRRLSEIQPNLEVLSDYNGIDEPITVRCVIHDHTYKSTPHRLLSGIGCQKCYDDRRGLTTKYSSNIFIERAKEIHGNKYDYSLIKEGDYKNIKSKLPVVCPLHGVFYIDYDHHINRKQGCPKCSGRYVTTEEIIERFKKVHGNDYDYSEVKYVNNRTKVTIKCNKCGKTFKQTSEKHEIGQGCPYCNTSKMENFLLKYFDENNIKYIYQTRRKTFKWLGRLSLDFYLPDYNLAIECQGEQHFKEIPRIRKKKGLRGRIENDAKKNQLCEENGVKLVYFTPKQFLNASKNVMFGDMYLKENIFNIDDAPTVLQTEYGVKPLQQYIESPKPKSVLDEKINTINNILNG